MLARIFSFYVLALPLLAAASVLPRDGPDDHKGRPPHRPPHRPPQHPPKDGINQCNVGSINCCNSVQDSEDKSMTSLASLLGIDLGSIAGLVGLNCSPVDVAGIGGNSCTAQPVCCTNNDFNGLINLGCSPININL